MTYTQAKDCIRELGREGLEELIGRYGKEVIEAAFECDIEPKNIEEAYAGSWKDDEEFTMEFYDSCYGLDKLEREFPGLHIDWEGTARDFMMDHIEENGHYFRCF